MLLAGVVALLVAVVRADLTPAPLGPAPAAASPGAVAASAARTVDAPAGGRLSGTWTGPLADPDTATVEVRLAVEGPGRGIRLDVPSLGCTYRGPDPTPVPGAPASATADVRAEGDPTPACVESARIRLGADGGPGPRADRVRYDLVASCADGQCVPRRATGVLTPR